MGTPLDDRPAARKRVYDALWVFAGVLTCTNVGFGTAVGVDSLPSWLTITNAVFPVLAAYVGYQARSNVDGA